MNKDTVARLLRLCTDYGVSHEDAWALRRISMTLHRWYELECGDSSHHGDWSIVRGHKPKRDRTGARLDGGPNDETFVYDDDGKSYVEEHHYGAGATRTCHTPIPDRERGAQRRLQAIMARYPALTCYLQTDPRGVALYILRKADIPEGADVSSLYSSHGVAVY